MAFVEANKHQVGSFIQTGICFSTQILLAAADFESVCALLGIATVASAVRTLWQWPCALGPVYVCSLSSKQPCLFHQCFHHKCMQLGQAFSISNAIHALQAFVCATSSMDTDCQMCHASVCTLTMQDFCKKVTAANVAVMASGGAPPTYRFYFHSQRADRETRILTESIVDKNTSTMQVIVKADDTESPEQFQRLYQAVLNTL